MKTEATLGSQIADLSNEVKDSLTQSTKLGADIAVVRTVNDRLVERLAKLKGSARKVPSIPDKTLWRLAFVILFIIMSLRKRYMVS